VHMPTGSAPVVLRSTSGQSALVFQFLPRILNVEVQNPHVSFFFAFLPGSVNTYCHGICPFSRSYRSAILVNLQSNVYTRLGAAATMLI
jgi:hypothetical protein